MVDASDAPELEAEIQPLTRGGHRHQQTDDGVHQSAASAPGDGEGDYLEGRALWIALLAGSAGNFLEFFDFALFGIFANEISASFFPPSDAATALLKSFAVFAGAFMMRPLGGVLFGYLGDRYGRVYSMRLAMNLMALPTTAIALLPTHAMVGVASTILLVAVRLLQGLSVGGAYGGLMTYAMEVSPPSRRGAVSALLKVFSGARFCCVNAVRRWSSSRVRMPGLPC
jgi:MHS family proline/betaine transporter-like MFS transporter